MFQSIRQRLFLLFVLFFAACPAYCSTYYVDPNGSDSGSGTIGAPFATITKAATMVSAGDTIYLRGGTHHYTSTISITPNGSSSNYITMQNYQNESVIVDFTGQAYGSSSRGISVMGNYWHLKKFTIQNAGDNGLYIAGSYNIAEQIVARMNSDSGIQLHEEGSYNLVLNCDSYLNYDAPNYGENADGFAVKSDSIGPGNVFQGCRAWYNADDGFDLYYTQNAITFIDCWAFRNGENLWGASSWNGDGNGFKLGASSGNHVLIRCLAYDTYHNGIDINGDTLPVEVYNCTAVSCGGKNFLFDEAGVASVLRNNISYDGSVSLVAAIDHQYNSWNGFTVTSSDFVSLDDSGIDGPRQADGSLPVLDFLRLAAGSDLIDGGTDVGEPYNGSKPDLGCFETGGSNPPGAANNPIPANGATNVSITQDLSWTAGSGATSRDVYFGTVNPPPTKVIADGTALTYDTGTMSANTTYYWRVDEKNTYGTTTGTVWSFTTAPPPPGLAGNPTPANGATNVSRNQDLSWTAGSGALTRDVYFDTVNPPLTQYLLDGTDLTLDPGTMAYGTTYYWRVDERNLGGTTTGTVWSFTTEGMPLPGAATNPTPTNGAINIGITTDLSWTAGSNATSRDVYFGTVNPPTFIGNQAGTNYDTGTMNYSTTYYWRIDEKNASGTTTGTVWSFTTSAPSAPGAASNPTPANGAASVSLTQDLSWTAGAGATSRDVYFGTVNPPPSIGNQTATTYDTGTMNYSTTYYWRIDEKNIGGTTTGTVWSFTTQADTTPPAAPTGLEAFADDSAVILEWNDNSEPDLAGYNIYRSTTSGSGYSRLNDLLVNDSNYIDDTAVNGTTYYYVVTAVDIFSNESAYSSEVSATPTIYGDFIVNGNVDMEDLAYLCELWLVNDCNETTGVDLDDDCTVNLYEFSAFAANWQIAPPDTIAPTVPSGLSATGGDATVSLDWSDNSESDLAGYNIYRSTTSGSGYSKLNSSLLSSSNYTDNAVTNDITYYYVVTAVDVSANESDDSGEASATPADETAPTAPTGLSATAGDATISLNWNDNSEGDLDGYNIYRSTTSGSGYSKLNGSLLDSSDYTDNAVTNDITYYYVVTAVDTSSNESAYSGQVSATPEAPITSLLIQENTAGFCSVDGSIDNNNSGFTGTGFANTTNGIGYGVDWSINVLTAGTYTFTWRYANGGSGDRPGNLIINGSTAVSGISFPTTGGWTSWTTASTNVSLTTGVKSVSLDATGGDGLGNIDYIEITGPNLTTAACQ